MFIILEKYALKIIIMLKPYLYGSLILPVIFCSKFIIQFNQKFLNLLYQITKKFSLYLFCMLFIYILVYTLEPVIMPYLVGKIISQFYLANVNNVWSLIGFSLVSYIATCLIWTFGFPIGLNLFAKIAPKISIGIRQKTVSHIFNMPYSFFHNNDSGVLISKIEILAASTEPSMELICYDIIPSFGAVFISIISLMKYSFFGFIVLTCWLVTHTVLSIWEYKVMYDLTFQQTKVLNNISGFLINSLQNILLVDFFNLKNRELNKLNDLHQQEQEIRKTIISKNGFFYLIRSFNSILFQGIIFNIVLILLWQYDKISQRIFVTLFYMNVGFLHLVWRLSYKIPKLFRLIGSAEGAMDIFSTKTIKHHDQLKCLPEQHSSVMIQNLSYKTGNTQLISSFSINIQPSSKVFITGYSGVGKTTLMNIFAGLLIEYEGDIIFSGTNIKNIKKEVLREYMAYITSENLLFNTTIFDNITFGIDTTDQEVQESIKLANLTELIKNYPADLHKTLNIDTLSSGQKQRLCIARAFFRRRKSLILFADEPFSSLDNTNADLIMNNIDREFKDNSVFCIDHTMRFVKYADIVIFMPRHGEMMIDKHSELYKYSDEYKLMCNNVKDLII